MAATERKHTKVEAAGNNLPSLTDDDGRMLQKLRFLYDIVFAKRSFACCNFILNCIFMY